jgi:hypothetical protein
VPRTTEKLLATGSDRKLAALKLREDTLCGSPPLRWHPRLVQPQA